VAVAGLVIETRRRGLEVFRLALCNLGHTAGGSRDRVVGYGAWIIGANRTKPNGHAARVFNPRSAGGPRRGFELM
jgi:hypothetical protein